MQTIEYKIVYTGNRYGKPNYYGAPETEYAKVTARDINSGYAKALKIALQPLGNGQRREIATIEFWQVL